MSLIFASFTLYKKKFSLPLLFNLFMTIFLTTSCDSQNQKTASSSIHWMKQDGKIKVLTTTEMINDIVKEIGQERIKSLSLIQGELDPHSYQLIKGDDEKLNQADLIFYNGLGLEHGPSLAAYLNKQEKAIALGDLIEQQFPAEIIKINDQKDPHIWMDVRLWSKIIPFVVSALSKIDPHSSQFYEENGHLLTEKMLKAHHKIWQTTHKVPDSQRYLVTSHDAFSYFTRAYLAEEGEASSQAWKKRFAAPEGLAPESQLSTTHIKSIIDYLTKYHVRVIFPESNVNQDSIRKIVLAAKEKGLPIKIACCPLYGDAMGPAGSSGATYLQMIEHNANMFTTHTLEAYIN